MAKNKAKSQPAPSNAPVRAEAAPPPHSMSSDAGFSTQGRRPIPPSGVPGSQELSPHRKAMMDKFNAGLENGTTPPPSETKPPVPPVTPPVEGDTGTSPDQDPPLDPVAEADVEELPLLPGETPPEDPDATPTPGDKTKDQKMVPLGALHEEREKHRTTKREVAELRSQVNQLLADFKKFSEGGSKSPVPNGSTPSESGVPEPIDDVEKAIRDLQIENKRLKAEMEIDRDSRTQDSQKAIEAERERHVSATDTELAKEGFKGFKMFIDKVGEKLVQIHRINPELANKLDNPAGWKRIYKEKVFPEISGVFVEKRKEEDRQHKLANKANAGLSGSPGVSGTPAPEPKKAWAFDDYLTWRRKVGVS